jgi:hypothetical protein
VATQVATRPDHPSSERRSVLSVLTPEVVAAQLDPLVQQVSGGVTHGEWGGDYYQGPNPGEAQGLQARLLAAIERLTPTGSVYRSQAEAVLKATPHASENVLALAGIAEALKADYRAGYMTSVEELVHADVFGDFLEMADELLSKGYKDPAAVIVGSVLEEHLRKLANKYGIAIEDTHGRARKADTLNADLVKEGGYNKLEQKSVTAWLDLRNKAAHGKYDEYDKSQVNALMRDARAFMIRHPA